MRQAKLVLTLVAGFGLAAVVASQDAVAGQLSNYAVKDLMEPCFEADNDARWGAAAEAECEQYLRGFTDALILAGAAEGKICLPELNRDAEVRWAFMRWVHEHFGERGQLAAQGLMATLETKFPCN
jgi:hypothetical protein